LCDIEELLAARGITVSYETIRNWCQKIAQRYCKILKKNSGRLGDTCYLDEVFINIIEGCITFGGQSIRMATKLTFWFKSVKTRSGETILQKVTQRATSRANQDSHR
jgi:hypothetical protein